MKLTTVAVALSGVLFLGGCVTKSTHEATLQELQATQMSLDSTQAQLQKAQAELADIQEKKRLLEAELDASQNRLNTSQKDLEGIRSQLRTLKQIEEETKKRNAIYASFVQKLQKMIDGGRLTVSIENGRIVINLPENVLFASGSSKLNEEGKVAISEVASVLSDFKDRRFQVEGHTDNIPIKSRGGYSNWELSSDRALSVVHLMSEAGVAPENLSAAGFGEFQPRADNSTKEGRTLNRRIEIVMLPNLDILSNELPKVAQ
jgi:chemotaxis protein MotB